MLDVLAHQGGWDEILLVLGPLVALGGLLGVASRRAKRAEEAPTEQGPPEAVRSTGRDGHP